MILLLHLVKRIPERFAEVNKEKIELQNLYIQSRDESICLACGLTLVWFQALHGTRMFPHYHQE